MPRNLSIIVPALLLAACAGDEPTAPVPAGPLTATTAATMTALASAAPTVSVLMSGLNAPRGLAWGPEGGLYVAEAGTPAINGPCATVVRGSNCYSGTGAVTRWWKIGDFAAGLGWVIQLTPSGQWREVGDVASVEDGQNPAGGPLDTNPFGLHAEAGERFVADAGGNSLLQVDANGGVSVVATFPTTPAPPPFGQSEAVPTEVERGPDGALYVSTLSGAPFLIGAAKIYRVAPGGTPTVYADGFKTVTDFTFGPDGSLYVLEYASAPVFFGGPGRVVHVALNGTRTVITAALTNPTGIIVGPDGVIYVSNRGNLAGVGEVLKIVP